LSVTACTFSGDFFQFCRQEGHHGYAISHFPEAQRDGDAGIIVENRPKRWFGPGIRYHISQALYAISIMLTALRWQAEIKIARLLERERPGRVQFDLCGDGPLLQELNDSIERNGLRGVVRTHGNLIRPALLKVYAACHVVIVPSRSDMGEGLSMVAAEAVICGRPVITSRVCAAVDVVPGAVAFATPDDPQSYAHAIRRFLDDPVYYERLCSACAAHQGQFFDPGTSPIAALEKVFKKWTDCRAV
jgi:glycosyltransferase involved in cell wall biosynthesis